MCPLPSHDSQINDSKFNSDRFGYVRLNNVTILPLCSGENRLPPGLKTLSNRFTASLDCFAPQQTTGFTDFAGSVESTTLTSTLRTLLSNLTAGIVQESADVKWKIPTTLAPFELAVARASLLTSDANRGTGLWQ